MKRLLSTLFPKQFGKKLTFLQKLSKLVGTGYAKTTSPAQRLSHLTWYEFSFGDIDFKVATDETAFGTKYYLFSGSIRHKGFLDQRKRLQFSYIETVEEREIYRTVRRVKHFLSFEKIGLGKLFLYLDEVFSKRNAEQGIPYDADKVEYYNYFEFFGMLVLNFLLFIAAFISTLLTIKDIALYIQTGFLLLLYLPFAYLIARTLDENKETLGLQGRTKKFFIFKRRVNWMINISILLALYSIINFFSIGYTSSAWGVILFFIVLYLFFTIRTGFLNDTSMEYFERNNTIITVVSCSFLFIVYVIKVIEIGQRIEMSLFLYVPLAVLLACAIPAVFFALSCLEFNLSTWVMSMKKKFAILGLFALSILPSIAAILLLILV